MSEALVLDGVGTYGVRSVVDAVSLERLSGALMRKAMMNRNISAD